MGMRNDNLVCKTFPKPWRERCKRRCPFHVGLVNPVNADVPAIEIVFGVDQRVPAVDFAAVLKRDYSDRTDAGKIRIGGFYVECQEAVSHGRTLAITGAGSRLCN
jgi:hypothetical protein